jgi:hypothetical protein
MVLFDKSIMYVSKVENCPFCYNKIDAKGSSKNTVRDSICDLYKSIESHLENCRGHKRKSEMIKVSINTIKSNIHTQSSSFNTEFMIIN